MIVHHLDRTFFRNSQIFAAETVWVDVAKNNMRVSNGRLIATAPVTGRTRNRSRALGAHAKCTSGVNPRDGAATSADFYNVDCRTLDRKTAHIATVDILISDEFTG